LSRLLYNFVFSNTPYTEIVFNGEVHRLSLVDAVRVAGDDRFSFSTLTALLRQNFGPNAPQSFTVEYTNVYGVTLKAESDVVLGEIFLQAHNAKQHTLKLSVNAVQVQSYMPTQNQPLYDLEAGFPEQAPEEPKPSILSSMALRVNGGYSRVLAEEPNSEEVQTKPGGATLTSLACARINRLLSIVAFMFAMITAIGFILDDAEDKAEPQEELGRTTVITKRVEFVYDSVSEFSDSVNTVMLNVPLALCMAGMSSIAQNKNNHFEIERDVSNSGLVNVGADGIFTASGAKGFVSISSDRGAVVVALSMDMGDLVVAYTDITVPLVNGINSAVAQSKVSPKIYVTGFGKGGSLAELLAMDIASGNLFGATDFSAVRLVTFDAPLVGDEKIASSLSNLVPMHLDIVSEERVPQPGFATLENTVVQTPAAGERNADAFFDLYETVLKTRSFVSDTVSSTEFCADAL
jgi:hypothetical protein